MMIDEDSLPLVLRRSRVLELLDISVPGLDRLVQAGYLHPITPAGGRKLYRREEVFDLCKSKIPLGQVKM